MRVCLLRQVSTQNDLCCCSFNSNPQCIDKEKYQMVYMCVFVYLDKSVFRMISVAVKYQMVYMCVFVYLDRSVFRMISVAEKYQMVYMCVFVYLDRSVFRMISVAVLSIQTRIVCVCLLRQVCTQNDLCCCSFNSNPHYIDKAIIPSMAKKLRSTSLPLGRQTCNS